MSRALLSVTYQVLYKALMSSVKEVAEASGTDHAAKGGYFRLYHLPEGALYYDMIPLEGVWVGGQSNREKEKKYKIISFEKAIRLAQHVPHFNHKTSWESRNVEKGFFGGAVLIDCLAVELMPKFERKPSQLIFSFSGLPEAADEAAMLLTAQRAKNTWHIDDSQLEQILTRTQNHFARQLLCIGNVI